MLAGQVQQDQVLRRVSMTDVEAREYYESNLGQYTQPATVMLRGDPGHGPGRGRGRSTSRATTWRGAGPSRPWPGCAGASRSRRSSASCPTACPRANGGLIGPIALGDLAAEVRTRIEALEVGGVGEVARTPAGYQILKLESSNAAAPTPFDEVREEIVNSVFNERRLEALERYLTTLRNEAIIEWKDDGLKAIYDERLTRPRTPPPGF